jgi:sulfate adenylyltransferase
MVTDPEKMVSSLAQVPSVFLSPSQRATVELLGNGSLAPVAGFMLRAEAAAVRETGRLPGAAGAFPCPVTLAVPLVRTSALRVGSWLALKDVDGTLVGGVLVEELSSAGDDVQVGGRVACLRTPTHADFVELRVTPDEVRRAARALGWNHVLAYQPRQFLHRGLEEGLHVARERLRASVLLQILVHHGDDLQASQQRLLSR